MQGDLFGLPSTVPQPETSTQKLFFLERYRVTLRLDQILAGLIALIVVYVLIFSFGVEKGKRLGMAELRAERAKNERMMQELSAKVFSTRYSADDAGDLPKTPRFEKAVNASVSQPTVATEKAAMSEKGIAAGKPTTPQGLGGKYTIQLITFTSQKAAEREMKRLMEKGYQTFVIPSGRFLQVCVSAFETRDKAVRALGELKAQEIAAHDAYIRIIPQQ